MEKGEEGAWLRFACAVVVPHGKGGCSCVLGLWAVTGAGRIRGEPERRRGDPENGEGMR